MDNQIIPVEYKATYCYGEYGNHIIACDFYITSECPNTCSMARRLSQDISHSSRTGLERFEGKYGEDWKLNEYWNKILQI